MGADFIKAMEMIQAAKNENKEDDIEDGFNYDKMRYEIEKGDKADCVYEKQKVNDALDRIDFNSLPDDCGQACGQQLIVQSFIDAHTLSNGKSKVQDACKAVNEKYNLKENNANKINNKYKLK